MCLAMKKIVSWELFVMINLLIFYEQTKNICWRLWKWNRV